MLLFSNYARNYLTVNWFFRFFIVLYESNFELMEMQINAQREENIFRPKSEKEKENSKRHATHVLNYFVSVCATAAATKK